MVIRQMLLHVNKIEQSYKKDKISSEKISVIGLVLTHMMLT